LGERPGKLAQVSGNSSMAMSRWPWLPSGRTWYRVAALIQSRSRSPNHSAGTRSRSCRSALRVGSRSKAMMWDASAINGYAVEANDGRLGTVSDLLFEDVGWVVRWLVVDTGNWLPGRRVLLPLSALGHPDQTLRHFPVKLTMQQVKNGPDVDTDQPVSRQIEARVYASYGWDPHWTGGYFPMESG